MIKAITLIAFLYFGFYHMIKLPKDNTKDIPSSAKVLAYVSTLMINISMITFTVWLLIKMI